MSKNGRKFSECKYMKEGFEFDYDKQPKYKVLIKNGKKVMV
jgi:hypothetical protein